MKIAPKVMFACAVISAAASGCARISQFWTEPASEAIVGTANPLPVPLADREWIMMEVADEVDNYFRLARVQHMQLIDSILTEGWIETQPRIGSTLLEPWHRDSQPGFEKLHSTLQTVRRFAKVRVVPGADQYWIDLRVYKELEDMDQPMGSSIGNQLSRHDNTIRYRDAAPAAPPNVGWIPLGRDFALEQTIMRNLQARIEKGCQSRGIEFH